MFWSIHHGTGKRLLSLTMLVLVLGFPVVLEARRRRVIYRRLSVRYLGSYGWVQASINGKRRHKLYRGRPWRVWLPAGRRYRVELRRDGKQEAQTLVLTRKRHVNLVFRDPCRERRGSVRIILLGKHDRATVTINGEKRGLVWRGTARVIKVDAGESYRIRLQRGEHSSERLVYVARRGAARHRRLRIRL